MGDRQYTLDELVIRTGFSKRQIRYYITEKLIPGAGDKRGPNAVYGEETLRRLLMIAILKERPVGPTGRVMSLAEIRHALDHSPAPDRTDLLEAREARRPEVRNFVRLSGPLEVASASEYLADLEDAVPGIDESSSIMMDDIHAIPGFSASYSSIDPVDEPPLEDLLQSLHSLLTELGSDTRFDDTVGEGTSWRRINSPDVEIQVRTPDTMEARLRLNKMAKHLGRLLAREE